nr:MAG TPA: hypothetical protein [Caudoviricetes sp.]
MISKLPPACGGWKGVTKHNCAAGSAEGAGTPHAQRLGASH